MDESDLAARVECMCKQAGMIMCSFNFCLNTRGCFKSPMMRYTKLFGQAFLIICKVYCTFGSC